MAEQRPVKAMAVGSSPTPGALKAARGRLTADMDVGLSWAGKVTRLGAGFLLDHGLLARRGRALARPSVRLIFGGCSPQDRLFVARPAV